MIAGVGIAFGILSTCDCFPWLCAGVGNARWSRECNERCGILHRRRDIIERLQFSKELVCLGRPES